MGIALALVILLGLALIGAPIALNASNHALGAFPSSIMIASGVVMVVVSAVLMTITKLYVKTRASEAFVRTGMSGLKVIRDGGAIVLPVVHQIVRVSLETIRLVVVRNGVDALITGDKLRADIRAEFFVRVQPNDESIQAAARSLGDKMDEVISQRGSTEGSTSSVSRLIEDKLVSALRTSAARKTLEQLNSERDEFINEVRAIVKADLDHNGFSLETVTISKLDQTGGEHLKPDNIFDAQGLRTIAEITQKNLTQRNEIVRNGEQLRTAQDVETRKKVLDLERAKAEAEAGQTSQVAVIQAEQERIAQEKQIEAQKSIQIAQVGQQKAIEIAKREQARDIEVAEKDKITAVTKADEKVEVAKRNQLQAIAVADALKAGAEEKLALAEAQRMDARQKILTVEQVATSDREKQKSVIAAEAAAMTAYVQSEKQADAAAYRTKTEAEAKKASADAEAEAMRKKSEAERDAQIAKADGGKALALAEAEGSRARLTAEADGTKARLLAEAEGQQAVAMVPVNVKSKEVDVEKRRVEDVLKPELEARATNGKAGQDFELAKLRIQMEGEVRIASAQATAQFYGKISANVYGTPEDVAKMGKYFSDGMGISQGIGGFMAGANSETLETTTNILKTMEKLAGGAVDRLKGGTQGNHQGQA